MGSDYACNKGRHRHGILIIKVRLKRTNFLLPAFVNGYIQYLLGHIGILRKLIIPAAAAAGDTNNLIMPRAVSLTRTLEGSRLCGAVQVIII